MLQLTFQFINTENISHFQTYIHVDQKIGIWLGVTRRAKSCNKKQLLHFLTEKPVCERLNGMNDVNYWCSLKCSFIPVWNGNEKMTGKLHIHLIYFLSVSRIFQHCFRSNLDYCTAFGFEYCLQLLPWPIDDESFII